MGCRRLSYSQLCDRDLISNNERCRAVKINKKILLKLGSLRQGKTTNFKPYFFRKIIRCLGLTQ